VNGVGISDTFHLESKGQLQATRKMIWKKELAYRNLDHELWPYWTDEEKAKEREAFATADAEYEKRKTVLRCQLGSLSDPELDLYFEEIGAQRQDVAAWLAPSPFVKG